MSQVDLAVPSQPTDDISLLVARYEDLTATEMAGNLAWFRLSRANQFHEAARALQVALDFEHFVAVLPINPADFTPAMIAELKELQEQTKAITGEFVRLNCLGETTGERGRATRFASLNNRVTDAIIQASQST